ncbi:MAG: phage tail sheath subtilisin-like domain-containing protein [Anaerolineae bacterium]
MPQYLTPDIYVEEVSGGARPIEAVGTSTAAFVGVAPRADAHVNEAVAINNWTEFMREFVPEDLTTAQSTHLSNAVYGFFLNGGRRCYVVNLGAGTDVNKGLEQFAAIDEIAIVAAPGFTDAASYAAVSAHCENLQDRVAVLEAPDIRDINLLKSVATESATPALPADGGDAGSGGDSGSSGSSRRRDRSSTAITPSTGALAQPTNGGYAAYYFPWIIVADPLAPNTRVAVPPSGHIAGIWARTDFERGVHKAPANELVRGAVGLSYRLTRDEQGDLNKIGVNCIRLFATEGIRVWGARTLTSNPEWKYLNVRRLFNMVKESIAENTRWIVFEPNDMTLWKSIRRDVSAFLTRLWRDGAIVGATPEQAFFVKCDAETNPPDVVDAGQVVVIIGIAPSKPAEFVIFRISQFAGGTLTETSAQ